MNAVHGAFIPTQNDNSMIACLSTGDCGDIPDM